MPSIRLYIQPGFRVDGHTPCFSGTPYAIKVQRILLYKGLPFEVDVVSWDERAERLPTISKSNKLPVLDYDDTRLEDSTTIAYFLEERHPEPAIIPADPEFRARSHFVEEWADEVLQWYASYEAARMNERDLVSAAYFRDYAQATIDQFGALMRAFVNKSLDAQGVGRYPRQRVEADVRRGLDALVAFVSRHDFVGGPSPSLGDISAFAQLHRGLAGTNPWLSGEVAARAPLVDWMRRVDEATASD